ncbi:unnamed protein product (mitochondrion) [Plasmodiophora brassicae]|uniref:t-SNARE coiled-coil homology domain-containing protein n=1 Tax=Plasmodiophora brassicae TaxID=37360 RepID=A0A0G4J3V5_PLABS|nr:hypothetical protein PBRA_002437 [Plasmodiophora brassicae]SPQ93639.1 unnamed protein product [Plasmodiophora brassicae]
MIRAADLRLDNGYWKLARERLQSHDDKGNRSMQEQTLVDKVRQAAKDGRWKQCAGPAPAKKSPPHTSPSDIRKLRSWLPTLDQSKSASVRLGYTVAKMDAELEQAGVHMDNVVSYINEQIEYADALGERFRDQDTQVHCEALRIRKKIQQMSKSAAITGL